MATTMMSDEHKEALANGRREGKVVRRYLESLNGRRPKRGRPRTKESLEARIAKIDQRLMEATAVERLSLVQERMNLNTELRAMDNHEDDERLEQQFVAVARSYGERKGITYGAWREVGVPAAVLKRAGIPSRS